MYVLTKLSNRLTEQDLEKVLNVIRQRYIKNRFYNRIHVKNLQRLSVWCSVGMDIEHGDWAILEPREAVTLINLDGWDPYILQTMILCNLHKRKIRSI